MSLEQEIASLEERHELTHGRYVTLATAESATGGGIARRLTAVPGSSAYVLGGIVAYSNKVKAALLCVATRTLSERGAVSEEVAREMAQGARDAFNADVGVSDTGVAGPGGATPDKAVGLFYISLSTRAGTLARRFVFDGERESNRREAEEAALLLVRDYLLQCIDS